mgnify:CR=1 FL=1
MEEALWLSEFTFKPLLLYSGVCWCPPCKGMILTVSRCQSFFRRMVPLIPGYCDGVTGRSLVWRVVSGARGEWCAW